MDFDSNAPAPVEGGERLGTGETEMIAILQRKNIKAILDTKRLSGNIQSNRRQPLSNVRGSESASEPRTLESGWHSCFVTGPNETKPVTKAIIACLAGHQGAV
jgi:hypothetical protein